MSASRMLAIGSVVGFVACGSDDGATPSSAALEAASGTPVSAHWQGGTLRAVKGDFDGDGAAGSAEADALAFVTRFAAEFGLTDPEEDLTTPVIAGSDVAGTAVVFERQIDGVPVYASQIRVHVDPDGRIRFASAGVPVLPDGFQTAPTFDAAAADAAAVEALGGAAGVVLERSLVVYDPALFDSAKKSKPTLAFRIALSAAGESRPVVFIDAATGRLLALRDHLLSSRHFTYSAIDDPATGTSFEVDRIVGFHQDSGGAFMGQGCGLATCPATYDPTLPACCGLSSLWIDEQGDRSADVTPIARELRGHLEAVEQWVDTTLGYDGWDGRGADVHAFAHVGPDSYDHARFMADVGAFLFGDGAVTRDIAAHEWGHALNYGSAWPLEPSGEPGAIGEALGDIIAAIHTNDWVLNHRDGTVLRDLSADATRQIADTKSTLKDASSSVDNGHVHYNSGIISRTADLLVHGKTHWISDVEVPRIDVLKVLHIYFRALRLYLLPTSSFVDARWQIEEACTSLIGWPGYPVTITYEDCGAVINAFAAVGLGEVDTDLDTWVDSKDNCPGEYPDSFNPDQLDGDDDGKGDLCDVITPACAAAVNHFCSRIWSQSCNTATMGNAIGKVRTDCGGEVLPGFESRAATFCSGSAFDVAGCAAAVLQ